MTSGSLCAAQLYQQEIEYQQTSRALDFLKWRGGRGPRSRGQLVENNRSSLRFQSLRIRSGGGSPSLPPSRAPYGQGIGRGAGASLRSCHLSHEHLPPFLFYMNIPSQLFWPSLSRNNDGNGWRHGAQALLTAIITNTHISTWPKLKESNGSNGPCLILCGVSVRSKC